MQSDPPQGPKILLAFDLPPDLRAQAKALAPAAQFYGRADLEAHPELLGELEIVYGHLASADFPRARRLKWLQTAGAGVDRLLTPEVRAHPALLTNVHIHGEGIAEHLFGLLLMLTRGLHAAGRKQAEHVWGLGRAYDQTLPGQTLGVLGLGAIGQRAAELGVAFGMRVLGLRRHARPSPPVERVYLPGERLEMLAACDVVMNTLPLTDETRHFLGREEFAALPPGALVFNIGRGGTIDTQALVAALRSGHLGGAGLDVTDPEPLPPAHPLWDLENVIITPHCSGANRDYAQRAGAVFLDNLGRYLAGQPLVNLIDRQAGY
jgi:phosphoglycerate dehydrogenase-like enzyme